MSNQKTILIAPLHWGLGHATRCIPIINELLQSGYKVMIASDGAALMLLKREFPQLEAIELPSYNITYSKKGIFFKVKMVWKLPKIQRTISAEKKVIQKLVSEGKIHGIISDNRMGVRSSEVPSVFITHQLNVLSGNTSYFSSKMHQKIIKKYDECWVPDFEGAVNLSGKLGHLEKPHKNIRYIGPLSRLRKEERPKKYDVLCLLSGPEPQRGFLEERLFEVFKNSERQVLLVRGVVDEKEKMNKLGNLTIANFLGTKTLQKAINESELIISRSGYTTIMDLAAIGKKAFFIPTPGQYEQVYLAKRLKQMGIVPSCKQHKFNEEKLNKLKFYKGLQSLAETEPLSRHFGLFEREGKL